MNEVTCNSCGYSGGIDTYRPSFSMLSDCRCPRCGSTDNQHNAEYAKRISKAMSCKHIGALSDAGKTEGGQPLLKCSECGSIGLDWSMRGEPMPKARI